MCYAFRGIVAPLWMSSCGADGEAAILSGGRARGLWQTRCGCVLFLHVIMSSLPPVTSARPTVAVIPAAGFGTRLRPLTNAIPKEMLPVGRRLALEHIVDELRAAGITRIVFVLSPTKEAFIRRHFGEEGEGISFSYALQPEMRGLGDAILCAEAEVTAAGSGPFVVALGDAVFEEPQSGGITSRLVASFDATQAAVGLVVQRVPRDRISRYGVVTPAGEPRGDYLPISGIVEKPAPEDAPSDFAAAARYVVRAPKVFEILRATPPGKGGEIHLTDALQALLRDGAVGVAVPLRLGEARHDLGGLDSYFKAFAAFALADPELGDGLRSYLRQRLAPQDTVIVAEEAGQ